MKMRERHELADGHHVDDERALADAADVDPAEDQRERDQERRAGPAGRQRRPVVAERDGGRRHDARLARGAREPLHPADLEADEIAERRARVEIRAAGRVEAAAQLGEAERDGERQQPDQDEADRAPRADLRRDLRRPEEDRAADHLVDAERGEVPASERALQRDHPTRLYHERSAALNLRAEDLRIYRGGLNFADAPAGRVGFFNSCAQLSTTTICLTVTAASSSRTIRKR